MENLEPIADISSDPERGEIAFAISGLWQAERMESFLRGLSKAAMPMVERKLSIHVLGDFTGFVTQTRDTGDAISQHLMNSRPYGLKRVAILGASALVKLQYKRLSEGIEVEFFDSRSDALAWLRRAQQQAA